MWVVVADKSLGVVWNRTDILKYAIRCWTVTLPASDWFAPQSAH